MIEDAVRELGYQPNPHARSLSRGRSDTIGLVIPNIANLYFAELAASVEQTASEHGLAMLLCVTLNKLEREREYLRRLGTNYLDGLIFVTNHPNDGELSTLINRTNRRVVVLDEDIVGARGVKIFSDNKIAGYLATKHLLDAGHRRIAIIFGPEAMMSSRDRLAGCYQAISEAGVGAELTSLLYGEYSPSHGRRAAEELLAANDGTSALIVASDQITIGAVAVFHERGIRIPDDLSLIGADDVYPFHLLSPPLTTIRQPVEAMGRRAVQLLIDSLRRTSSRSLIEHLAPELITRDSVAKL